MPPKVPTVEDELKYLPCKSVSKTTGAWAVAMDPSRQQGRKDTTKSKCSKVTKTCSKASKVSTTSSDGMSNASFTTRQTGFSMSRLGGPKKDGEGGRIFADTESLVAQREMDLTDNIRDVTVFYKDTGISQYMARSAKFQACSFFMVCVSSIWISVEIDASLDNTWRSIVLQGMEHFFCIYFLLELLIQFCAFKEKRDVKKDTSFMFDAFLVFMFVLDTWILSALYVAFQGDLQLAGMRVVVIFRMLRVLKVLRLARVLRMVPELMVIIRGIALAMSAISIIISLLAVIIYMAGIGFRVLLEGTELGARRFSTVPESMGTLLIEATLSGSKGGRVIQEAHAESPVFSFLLLAYVLLANVTIMGVLGGLLVQTVKTVAEVEKAEADVMRVSSKLDRLWEMALEKDEDNDQIIDIVEWTHLLQEDDTKKVLAATGVDVESLRDSTEFLFRMSEGKLTKPEFKRAVLDQRLKMGARIKDHIDTRRFFLTQIERLGCPPLPGEEVCKTDATDPMLLTCPPVCKTETSESMLLT